jgi:hypothetical protein
MKKGIKGTHKNTKDQITRKEALSKMGKYATLTAIGTFITLNPLKAQTLSFPPPEPNGDVFEDL